MWLKPRSRSGVLDAGPGSAEAFPHTSQSQSTSVHVAVPHGRPSGLYVHDHNTRSLSVYPRSSTPMSSKPSRSRLLTFHRPGLHLERAPIPVLKPESKRYVNYVDNCLI